MPSNLAAILNDLQSLTGNPEAGRVVFESAACSACHDNEAISTLTEMLWQSAEDTLRRLPQFSGYTAEMYIIESIIHPSAYVVPGYRNLMPDTYLENLSLQQLDDLIAYLRAFALPQRSQTPTPISATVVPTIPPSAESATLLPTVVPPTLVVEPIPPTATAIIEGTTGTAGAEAIVLTATQIVREATNIAAMEQLTPTVVPTEVTTYVIQEGDTLLEIAMRFDTTLQTLAELNPQIDFSNCDFTRFSGGANCIILLRVGDTLTVPLYSETRAMQSILATPTPVPNYSVTSTPISTATAA